MYFFISDTPNILYQFYKIVFFFGNELSILDYQESALTHVVIQRRENITVQREKTDPFGWGRLFIPLCKISLYAEGLPTFRFYMMD